MLNAPCKSWKTVENRLLLSSGLKDQVQLSSICPTHFCFSGTVDDASPQKACLVCGCDPEPDHDAETVTYIHAIQGIESMVKKESCERLYSYISNGFVDDILVKVFTDCSKYKAICQRYG